MMNASGAFGITRTRAWKTRQMAGRKRRYKTGLPPEQMAPDPEAVNSGTVTDSNGRTTKCTPERQKAILHAILMGNYRYVACMAAGIDSDTLGNWHRWAKEGTEPYASFWKQMEVAEGRMEAECVQLLSSMARGVPVYGMEEDDQGQEQKVLRTPNMNALIFLLERRGARRWAPKQHVEHSGTVGGSSVPQVSILLPPEEELPGEE